MEKPVFPEFHLFPRITRAAEFIESIALAGSRTELCLSTHKRGAAEMLDEALDEQLTLEFGE